MTTSIKRKCPHCGREIEVTLIEGDLVCNPEEKTIQLTTECPHCGADLTAISEDLIQRA